jgi:two-component system, NarL family, sensor histidine kinase BarA
VQRSLPVKVKMRILLLDDEAAQRKLIRSLIEAEGHEVYEAESAVEAIELAHTHRFHLALLDWELGGPLTGADVAREIPTGCAKFMVTGHSIAEMRANWRDPLQGILEIVQKPVDWDHDPSHSLKALILRVEKSLEDTKP